MPTTASRTAIAMARRRNPDAAALYLLGLTLPFPLLGVPLNELFTLSLCSVVGLIFAARRLARRGWQPLHGAAAAMLLAFAGTAVMRHPFSSYVLSLGALAMALLPLTTPALNQAEMRVLMRGLMAGLWLTLASVALAILIQLWQWHGALGPLAPLFVRPEETGVFLGYIRPVGGFSEPSHLAIYLAAVYVILDLRARLRSAPVAPRVAVALAIVFTGSVSGLLLFGVYVAARMFGSLWRMVFVNFSGVTLLRGALAAGLLLGVALSLGPSASGFTDEYTARLVKTLDDIESQNLVGSEGSRVNAVLALPDYWESKGWPGFAMGTGYANYQSWLQDNYGYLGDNATFSRGGIDSILIAVFLSTGALGFVAYLAFLYRALSGPVVRAHVALVLFILALNLSYGYLISSLYWTLLFVLFAAARLTIPARAPAPAARARRPARRPLRA